GIAEVYAQHRVMISVSGHYHRGISLQEKEGVSYFVCPALCEAPFSYAVLTLRENGFHLETKRLDLSHAVMLHDLHVHTRLAYCGKEEMEPEAIMEAAGLLNLSGFAFTEHMAQLYVPGEDFWSGRFVDHPGMMERNMGTYSDRVSEYRELVGGCRNGRVLMGVEAEVDKDGRLCMLERDKNIWDIVLGAVHFLPGRWADKPLQGFMWANERLAENRVDILAHPFRFFRKSGGGPPTDLYRPLARILREHRVAAEVNFHINRPDPSFFRICLEEGVRISLGSDAHELHMIGCDRRYVDFLETLAPQEQWADFLYRPER
ncbi:MAG: PHP domain-containing protein, partial [Clostridia bacterium]